MKYIRGFAVGLLTTLSILTTIYLLVTYVKFNPDAESLETASKLTLFMKKAQFNKDYFTIVFLTALSAFSGVIFKKKPAVAILVTALSFSYILQLYDYTQLTKRPMVIIIMTGCALALFIAAAAVDDRFTSKRSLSGAGCSLTLFAFIISGVCNIFEYRVYSVADKLDDISEAGISLADKVRVVPEFVKMIWLSLQSGGEETAREAYYVISKQLKLDYMKGEFFKTLNPEDFPLCASLTVLIFGSLILTFVFSRKNHLITALISAVPLVWAVTVLFKDRFNTLPLPVILLLASAFVCFIAEYDQIGKGHDTNYDIEPDAPAQDEAPASNEDTGDEVYYL